MPATLMRPDSSAKIDRLIEEHTDKAYTSAYRLTGNAADAWDLVQETFLRVLEKADLYNPALDFGSWLHRVLYRVYLNRRRGEVRLRETVIEPDDDGRFVRGAHAEDASSSPEGALERSEIQENVLTALARLPKDMRACLLLVDVEGKSYDEAAEILDWPVGSVAGRLFRARRLARQRLEEEGGKK